MISRNIVEDLRIMARVVDESQGEATVTMLSGSLFDEAADEIERLRKEVDEERSSSKTFEALLGDATDELERITKERNGWQAEAAGLSQDISNADDEIELLQKEINDLRLQVVALSSPLVPAEPVEKTDLMPRTNNFSELRDEARRDPKRARRIDEAKERALEEIAAYGDRQSEEISNVEDELEDAADEIQKLRDAGDLLAQGIRTGSWDEALEAWDDARRN